MSDPWSELVQALLAGAFGLFALAMNTAITPTYNDLFVPAMSPGQLFPSLSDPGGGATFLAEAAKFSSYLLVNIVDPAVALVAVGLGLLYLSKALYQRSGPWAEALIVRFIVAVVVANFTLLFATGILDLGAITYPTIAAWDGGAWQNWTNLAGWGQGAFIWQNGALAFVLTFVEFSLVLLLAILIGLRDAGLAVLLVVLPVFTLLWPIRPFSALARRGWMLFIELALLPCVLVVPLELAVHSPNPILLVAFFTLALSTPYLISISGAQLSQLGFPAAGAALSGAVERGLLGASRTTSGPIGGASAGGAGIAGAVTSSVRAAGSVALPAVAPAAIAGALGQGASHLVQHVRSASGEFKPSWKPVPPAGEE